MIIRFLITQMYYRIRLTKKLLGAQDSTEMLNTFTSEF